MIIDMANVGATARMVQLEFDPDEIDLDGERVSLRGKTTFNGEIKLVDARAHLSGKVNAEVLLDCTRCLEPISRNFEFRFRSIFVGSVDEDTNAEAEVSDDALDESLVENGQIDIAEAVREQLMLTLPEQIFCREDCKGLCAKCGSDLNLIDCKCADDEIDPRWAALKNLK